MSPFKFFKRLEARVAELEKFRDGFRMYGGQPPAALGAKTTAQDVTDLTDADRLHDAHRKWRDE